MKARTASIAKRRLVACISERRNGGRWVMVSDGGYLTYNIPLGPIARVLISKARGRWRYLQ